MADDDLYEGFEDASAARPTATAAAPSGAAALNPIRGMTARAAGGDGPRPLTSVKAAGFTSKPGAAARNATLDAMAGLTASTGVAPTLAKQEQSPESVAKEMEARVHALLEASASAAARNDAVMALERAKEAGRKERALVKYRDANDLADGISLELTYAVCFNLAQAYHLNKMYAEAINTYSLLIKNKTYASSGRLRVNVGGIYFEQRKYTAAIKMFRMALDQIGPANKALKLKVQRNIGLALVRMGQFQDAINAFETIMDTAPDFPAGLNLIVCYYALGDAELMRKGFLRLLTVPLPDRTDEEDEEGKADEELSLDKLEMSRDTLKEELRARQKQALGVVATAARLIAPVLDARDWVAGYDWIIEQLRRDHSQVASELQICKALQYMATKRFDKAIEELKAFEKKDVSLKARAATNLSFLYFLEGDMAQASKYANLAVKHDRYNAKALVNMGNCLMDRGDLERAKELYLEAIGVEADCVEAIFNLGLVNKQLGVYHEALQAFEKLHSLVPASPEVMLHIATLHEVLGNYKAAIKYYNLLISKVPSDPGVLFRLGALFAKEEDDTQAFHYHHESYRYFPVNLEVISWLGIWFVKSEMYEKAIQFFERASEIQPAEAKWKLMVASCHRRMQNYTRALELYEVIHTQHPENIECLRYLVALCKDLNRRYDTYEAKLVRLERAQAAVLGTGQADHDIYSPGRDDARPQSASDSNYDHVYNPATAAAVTAGYRPDAYVGAVDDGRRPAAAAALDSGFGTSADRFAAPTSAGYVGNDGAAPTRQREDDFADADLSDLLTE